MPRITTMRTTLRSASSPDERLGVEPREPGPEGEVRVRRLLRLQADEVLDGVEDRPVRPLEQQLAGQRRPVQRAQTEDVGTHGCAQPTSCLAMPYQKSVESPSDRVSTRSSLPWKREPNCSSVTSSENRAAP